MPFRDIDLELKADRQQQPVPVVPRPAAPQPVSQPAAPVPVNRGYRPTAPIGTPPQMDRGERPQPKSQTAPVKNQSLIDAAPPLTQIMQDPEFKAWQAQDPDGAAKFVSKWSDKVTRRTTMYRSASPERKAMMDARLQQLATGKRPEVYNPYAAEQAQAQKDQAQPGVLKALEHGAQQSILGNLNTAAGDSLPFMGKDYGLGAYTPQTWRDKALSMATTMALDLPAYVLPGAKVGGMALRGALDWGVGSALGEFAKNLAEQRQANPSQTPNPMKAVPPALKAGAIGAGTGAILPRFPNTVLGGMGRVGVVGLNPVVNDLTSGRSIDWNKAAEQAAVAGLFELVPGFRNLAARRPQERPVNQIAFETEATAQQPEAPAPQPEQPQVRPQPNRQVENLDAVNQRIGLQNEWDRPVASERPVAEQQPAGPQPSVADAVSTPGQPARRPLTPDQVAARTQKIHGELEALRQQREALMPEYHAHKQNYMQRQGQGQPSDLAKQYLDAVVEKIRPIEERMQGLNRELELINQLQDSGHGVGETITIGGSRPNPQRPQPEQGPVNRASSIVEPALVTNEPVVIGGSGQRPITPVGPADVPQGRVAADTLSNTGEPVSIGGSDRTKIVKASEAETGAPVTLGQREAPSPVNRVPTHQTPAELGFVENQERQRIEQAIAKIESTEYKTPKTKAAAEKRLAELRQRLADMSRRVEPPAQEPAPPPRPVERLTPEEEADINNTVFPRKPGNLLTEGETVYAGPVTKQPKPRQETPSEAEWRQTRISQLQEAERRLQEALKNKRGQERQQIKERLAKVQDELKYHYDKDVKARPNVYHENHPVVISEQKARLNEAKDELRGAYDRLYEAVHGNDVYLGIETEGHLKNIFTVKKLKAIPSNRLREYVGQAGVNMDNKMLEESIGSIIHWRKERDWLQTKESRSDIADEMNDPMMSDEDIAKHKEWQALLEDDDIPTFEPVKYDNPETNPTTDAVWWSEEMARQRIKDRGKRTTSGLDLDNALDYTIVTGHQLARRFTEFKDWAKAMIQRFGDTARPHLERIWQSAKDLLRDEEGSSDFRGMIDRLKGKHREEIDVPLGMVNNPRVRRRVQNGVEIVTEAGGREWEVLRRDPARDRATLLEVVPDEGKPGEGVIAAWHRLTQPLHGVPAEIADKVMKNEATRNRGHYYASQYMDRMRDMTEAERARVHRVMDDPNNVGGHNIVPTAKEQEAIDIGKRLMDEAGNEALRAGLITNKLDVYAPRLYHEHGNPVFNQFVKEGTGAGSNLSTSTPSAIRRKFQYLHEAEAAGFHPVYDASLVANHYNAIMRKVAAKDLINEIKTMQDANGKPLIISERNRANVPAGYDRVDVPALDHFYVHPYVRDVLNSILGGGIEANQAYRAAMWLKGNKLGIDMASPMSHLGNVKSKALTSGGLFKSWPNPLNGLDRLVPEGSSLKRLTSPRSLGSATAPDMVGREILSSRPQEVDEALKDGLHIQGSTLSTKTDILSGEIDKPGFIRKLGESNPVTNTLVKLLDGLHDQTWGQVREIQLGLWKKYKEDMVAQGIPVEEAGRHAAYLSNLQVGMMNKTSQSGALRAVMNLGLVSNSWTASNLKLYEVAARQLAGSIMRQSWGKVGLPPNMRGEAGEWVAKQITKSVLADVALMKLLVYMGSAIGAGYLLGNWSYGNADNDEGRQNRILIGTDADANGQTRHEYMQSPVAKVTEDATESIPFPVRVGNFQLTEGNAAAHWQGKLSPLVKSIWEAAAGHTIGAQQLPLYKQTDGDIQRGSKAFLHVLSANLPSVVGSPLEKALAGQEVRLPDLYRITTEADKQPTYTTAARIIALLTGASISRGAKGGPEAGKEHRNEMERTDQREDVNRRVNKLLTDGKQDEAINMMVNASDAHGDPLYSQMEIRRRLRSSLLDPATKQEIYKARRPGYAASER